MVANLQDTHVVSQRYTAEPGTVVINPFEGRPHRPFDVPLELLLNMNRDDLDRRVKEIHTLGKDAVGAVRDEASYHINQAIGFAMHITVRTIFPR